jgi:hypothetical protein
MSSRSLIVALTFSQQIDPGMVSSLCQTCCNVSRLMSNNRVTLRYANDQACLRCCLGGAYETSRCDAVPIECDTGVAQNVISRYIAAKVTPSPENALALIRGLNGVPVEPERSFLQALLGEHEVTLHAIIVSLAEADTKTIEAVAHLIGAKPGI